MGFYMRVLSPSSKWVPATVVARALRPWKALVFQTDDAQDRWEHGVVCLADARDKVVLVLERNSVAADSLGEEELGELEDELDDARPAAGATWVQEYLKRVQVIYAVQALSLARRHEAAVDAVLDALRDATDGIVQVDGEGFWNERGQKVATTD